MSRLGTCEPCYARNVLTKAVVRLDGVPVCRTHARGESSAIRERSSVNASEADAPRVPEPKLIRREPVSPRHTAKAGQPSAPAAAVPLPKPMPVPLMQATRVWTVPEGALEATPRLVRRLVKAVAAAFGVPEGYLWHRSNQPQFVLPRQTFVWLLRTYTTCSYPEIATLLRMHHTTLMHGFGVIRARLLVDAELVTLVDRIVGAACLAGEEVAA